MCVTSFYFSELIDIHFQYTFGLIFSHHEKNFLSAFYLRVTSDTRVIGFPSLSYSDDVINNKMKSMMNIFTLQA